MKKKYYLDVKKLNKIENFSRKMTNKLFVSLIEPLNKINKVNYNRKQWYTIVFPWVALFTQNFVHYDTLAKANRKNFEFKNKESIKISLNHRQYLYLISQDHIIDVSKIYKLFFKNKNLKVNFHKYEVVNLDETNFTFSQKLISQLIKIYNFLVIFFPHFYTDRLNPKLLLKLIIKFKSLPVILDREFDLKFNKQNIDIDLRKKFYHSILSDLKERIITKKLIKFLAFQIPLSYLENFTKYKLSMEKISFKKTKFFLIGYPTNDKLRFFLSRYKKKGQNLIMYQHGGGFGNLKYYDEEDYYKNISNLFLSWYGSKDKKVKQTPSSYFINKDIKERKKYDMVMINAEFPSFYRYYFPLIGDKAVHSIQQQIKFIKNLSPDARNKLSVRHPNRVCAISTREEYKKAGMKNHEIKNNSYKVFIGKSKLVIHSYFATTFFQAIMNDIPTILLIKKNSYFFNSEFKKIMQKLHKTKILHFSSKSAADHVNKIYSNPDIWWTKKETIKSRIEFKKKFGFTNKSWSDVWVNNIYNKIY